MTKTRMIYHHQKMSMRNYRKEYDNYHSRPEQKLRRAARKSMKDVPEDKDVHHKDNNPLNNDKKNLSVVTQKYNRTEPRLREKKLKEWSEAVDVQKVLKKVKGLSKKQLTMLQTLPQPALLQIVQQLSGLVMGEVKEYMDKWETKNESLWANIRKRRAAGKPKKKPGDKGYPKTLDVGEDAQAAADLKAKQAGEADGLKDKQDGEASNLKKKHERENEQQKKKDESEKESERARDAREEIKTEDMGTVTGPAIAGTGDDSSTVVVKKRKKVLRRIQDMARNR